MVQDCQIEKILKSNRALLALFYKKSIYDVTSNVIPENLANPRQSMGMYKFGSREQLVHLIAHSKAFSPHQAAKNVIILTYNDVTLFRFVSIAVDFDKN